MTFDCASAQTATSSTPSTAQKDVSLHWVRDAGKAYVLQAVQPPPAAGSDQEKTDMADILKAQSTRTAVDIDEAKADQNFTIESLSSLEAPDFNAKNYPICFEFLHNILAEADKLNGVLQAKYQRHRPYQDHPEIKNLYTADGLSYPGAQAAESRMITLALTQLFPKPSSTGPVLERDLVIAQSGINAGVNYTSDVISGRQLAHSLLYVLQGNPVFMSDLAKAQEEIKEKNSKDKKP